jgi:hypothetical protein
MAIPPSPPPPRVSHQAYQAWRRQSLPDLARRLHFPQTPPGGSQLFFLSFFKSAFFAHLIYGLIFCSFFSPTNNLHLFISKGLETTVLKNKIDVFCHFSVAGVHG